MNATALAVSGYIGWFLILLFMLGGLRTVATLRGKPANSFRPDGTDVSEFSVRLVRAHANCYESFPFVGGLMLVALATQNAEITHSTALIVLGARIAQSIIHLASTSVLAVQLRFACFLIQAVIAAHWAVALIQKFSV